MKTEISPVCFELLDYFEEECKQPRNRRLFEAIRDGLNAGMDREVMEKAIRLAQKNADGSPHYAAKVIGNWNAVGVRKIEDTPGGKKIRKEKETIAQRLHIDQQEPTGELEDWEKDWLREIGRL